MSLLGKLLSAIFGGSSAAAQLDVPKAFNELMAYTAKKEGGLAYGTVAGDAELERAPCGLANGLYPHTSRGVTWGTYKSYCAAKNKGIDCDEWLNFSADENSDGSNPVWKDVLMWVTRRGKEFSSNEVVAYLAGLFYWGGWSQSIVSRKELEDTIKSASSVRGKAKAVIALRLEYFKKLAEARGMTEVPHGWTRTWRNYREIINNS